MEPLKVATVWLGGCSGCHMSFLDMDEWLIDLGSQIDLVYSPLADIKTYPELVDLALIEGAIANVENLAMAQEIRRRTRVVISFGDCAVTGNVTAMRNNSGLALDVIRTVYLIPQGNSQAAFPTDREIVPDLLDEVLPVHAVIPVDHYLPGCPPPAGRIRAVLEDLLAGREPQPSPDRIRFG